MIYFKQAARGVPIRMAILGMLLGRIDFKAAPPEVRTLRYGVPVGENPCPNKNCITHTEQRHPVKAFTLASRKPLRACCGFCDREIPIHLVGCSTTRHFHAPDSPPVRKIRPDHLIFFHDEEEARALGFTAPVGSAS